MPQPTAAGRPLNVLFVCVGNSCRSQMAEAFANQLGRGCIHAWSAGSRPLGFILDGTYDVMEEKGMTLGEHMSKSLRDVPVAQMDVVVSMGCEVDCPVPAGFKGRVIEWEIPDPYGGDLESYRQVRDLIEGKVAALLKELEEQRAEKTHQDSLPSQAPKTK